MKDYENLTMHEFTKGTPLGVAMVRAAYDIGYDFFPNLYREEVIITNRTAATQFLRDNIKFCTVDDDFQALQEFSGSQVCPSFPDGSTALLLRSLRDDPTKEITSLSIDCYKALDKGVIDGYLDTIKDLINKRRGTDEKEGG